MSANEIAPSQQHVMVIPSFGKMAEMRLDMAKIREADLRIIEAKTVNPATYAELEHAFNESYRDLKRHLSTVGYAIAMAQKSLEEAKADVILGSYAEAMQGKPVSYDTLDKRNAHLIRDPAYSAAMDRVAQMKALESNLDGKIKVMENVCRYMRKKMDLLLRSGVSSADYYNTIGKK